MTYDAIVLGLGAMGSAAAAHLARRGRRVVALDQFGPAHDRGSSHGRSRIIREAYFEHPSYVPLIWRAYEQWADLQSASGRRLLVQTGGINIGPPDGTLIRGMLESARVHRLAHEVLDGQGIRRRFPVFQPADGVVGVYEPRAGVLFPEACILAQLAQAARAGAELRHNEQVVRWHADSDRVEVWTARRRYEGGHLVVAAGPWAPTVLADLRLPLVVERQVTAWFLPVSMVEAFDSGVCPVHIWEVDGRYFYGFPRMNGERDVKFAEHASGHPTTADGVRREVSPREVEALRRDFVARFVPAADGQVASTSVCLFTMTPDGHFIIDRHPRHPNVVIACGFSGHGFKFAPVVGEILTDLVIEAGTRHDAGLFRATRFTPAG